MIKATLPFFLFLTLCSCYHYSNLTYQAHGFNDLNFFLQQLIKGTIFFKLDVSEATSSSCALYSTWNNDNECECDDYFNICCLGFRGDTGSEPLFDEPFNTTYDFLRLLNSSKYDFIWKRDNALPEYNSTKYIALNFQYAHSLSNMTKYFLYNLLKILDDRNLNIQLLTGSNNFITDYEDKCNSGSCDYMEQYIANSNVMFQSSSNNETAKRITNFNVNYMAIVDFCQNGFPDWPDLYGLPYLFWEPSSEDTIKFVLNTFQKDSCKKTALHNSLRDIKITSNLEPEMIEIYSKEFNTTEEILKIFVEGGENPNVEIDNETNSIYFSKITDQNQTLFQIIGLNQTANETMNLLFEKIFPFKAFKFQKKESFIAFFTENMTFLYQIKYDQFFYLSFIEFIESQLEIVSGAVIVKNQLPFLCHLFRNDDSSFKISIFDVFHNETLFEEKTQIPEDSLNADLDSFNDEYEIKIIITFSKNVLPQDVSGIFGIIYELSEAFSIINVTVSERPFDFGDYPSLKLVQIEDSLMLLEVHTDGLCQCGMLMNNNEFGKCHFADDERHYPLLNTENLMNYNWGTFEDFKARLLEGKVINGCDEKILHAKFNNGRKPKASIFYFNGRLQALVANEYVAYDDLPLVTRLICGGNQINLPDAVSAKQNIVLQSFSLTDRKVFSYLQ